MRTDTDADPAVATPAAKAEAAKHLATLKARCALAGVALTESTDDHGRPVFVASRWALTRQFESLNDLDQWVDRVTGKTE